MAKKNKYSSREEKFMCLLGRYSKKRNLVSVIGDKITEACVKIKELEKLKKQVSKIYDQIDSCLDCVYVAELIKADREGLTEGASVLQEIKGIVYTGKIVGFYLERQHNAPTFGKLCVVLNYPDGSPEKGFVSPERTLLSDIKLLKEENKKCK